MGHSETDVTPYSKTLFVIYAVFLVSYLIMLQVVVMRGRTVRLGDCIGI